LKAGLWFRRARLVILAPDPRHPRRAQAENPLNDLSEFSRPPLSAMDMTARQSHSSRQGGKEAPNDARLTRLGTSARMTGRAGKLAATCHAMPETSWRTSCSATPRIK